MKNTKYTSEAMNFINTLLNQAGSQEERLELRSTWWDRDFIDIAEQKAYHNSEVKHDSYVYFSYPNTK